MGTASHTTATLSWTSFPKILWLVLWFIHQSLFTTWPPHQSLITTWAPFQSSSCHPYNIRKIRPFLSEQAAQLLVQALVLSRLDYCNALLTGLPACTIKPLQLIQNAAARVVFNKPKKAHVTPLFIRLHWLSIAARIKFKVLMFAYKTTTDTAPIYLNLLVQTYAPCRSLRSASEWRLVVPFQRGTKSLSRTFSWTVPSWWNDLPISIRTAESLAIFKKHLKTHLFRQHLTN